jgi:hypothetical protein
LADSQQAVTLAQGSLVIPLTVTPGTTSSFQVAPSTYAVTAAELTNQDQTVVATAEVSSDTITGRLNTRRSERSFKMLL